MSYAGKKANRHILSMFGLLILTSLLLSVLTIAPLSSEDRITISRGLCLFGLGLMFFSSSFSFLNNFALKTAVGTKYMKEYKLSVSDILDISNKVVSSIQAMLSCLTGVVVCTYSCSRSFLHTSHYASEAYAWFGTSYFFYDIWSMYRVHTCVFTDSKQNGETCSKPKNEIIKFGHYVITQPIIIGHHLFIGSFGFLVIVYLRGGLGDCIFGHIYLMELSTPCVSLRGILSRMGLKASRTYVVNGMVMLVTFFFCRVFMFPYVCYLHAQATNMAFFEAVASLPRGCKIGITILLLPQLYWFWLMMKGAAKIFCSPEPAPNAISRKRRSANHNHS